MPDPFPNELVEAAAKALYDAEDKHGSGLYGISARAVLAAVVPLIEQRVIAQLTGEAGERPPIYDGFDQSPGYVTVEDAERWVACGVAAERARGDKLREAVAQALVVLGSAEWFAACASQPCPSCDPSGEGVEIGGEIKGRCRESIDQLRAALAPERTTGEGT